MIRSALLALLVTGASVAPALAARPNILLILADDMGYGDPRYCNPESQCVTPNIDRLAAEGRRFTDAHAAGSVCVPSRYGLLTGRYPFRQPLKESRAAVINDGRPTIATLLHQNGYSTAMVGKWHLGFDGGPDHDYSKPLTGGPVDRGFDSYFGLPHSLDITPYCFIRNRKAVAAPTLQIDASASEGWSPIQGAFWRAGGIAPGFRHSEVLDRLSDEAVKSLGETGKDPKQPFFLYLALTAPHTPWLPAEKFRGSGHAGLYSEFVAHVDDVVGRVLKALDDVGRTGDTLVLFSSDNGPVWYDTDEGKYGHHSAGPFRGMKGDAWEGGHRVPFIVRWPGHVPAGTECDQTLGFVDVFATFAALLEVDVPDGAAEDSANMLPAYLGTPLYRPLRGSIVLHHSGSVIRRGPWKLINHLGSGGFSEPRREEPQPNGPHGQLYNLADDPGETTNLWNEQPELVQQLLAELKRIRE
jgi:arylsulfatase A-like enzyme